MNDICKENSVVGGKLGELRYGGHEIEDEDEERRGSAASAHEKFNLGLVRNAPCTSLRDWV